MTTYLISFDTFVKLTPRATEINRLRAYVPIMECCLDFKINTNLRFAAFLAQLLHESGNFRWREEIATGEAYTNRADLGNTLPEARRIALRKNTSTGRLYKGRGYIQITGFYNYRRLSRYFSQNFTDNPELIAQHEWAAKSAGWFWEINNLNISADKKDFERITRIINGGMNGWEDRLAHYTRIRNYFALAGTNRPNKQ